MIVLPSSSRCAQSMIAFVAFILVLFQQTCSAKHHHSVCPPSSCGKIRNITYPFRLRGDPRGCGLPRYELDCVNNLTMLTLFSGKYYVQDINYNKYQIQVTDAGVVEDTACSFPRYFLSPWNFSFISIPDYTTTDPLTLGDMGDMGMDFLQHPIIEVLNCTNPVTDDPRYVPADTGRCDSVGHIYFLLTFSPKSTIRDVNVGCYLKVATFANERMLGSDNRNVSYADIHKGLVDGFSLSWLLPVACRDHCGKGIKCSLNETTEQVECDPQRYCHYVYHTTTKCGIPSKLLGDTRDCLTDSYQQLTCECSD
ncbi:hypothetical protein CR513_19538, partial [Mucuna pruriens]